MKFSAKSLVEHLDAELYGPPVEIDGVSIDSRTVEANELFVPIVAERDGHEFIETAVQAGASAFLTSAENPKPVGAASAFAVADTIEALGRIGGLARRQLGGPVIAITGSVGKTSTKDLTLAACSQALNTHASVNSFNNELGVPLTLANAPDGTEVVIAEMGARGIGHIRDLCAIAQPTIGVVTRVALAHSELFGSLQGIAQAKGELVEALPASGVAVLNADDPNVAAMARRTDASVITFGCESGDVRAVDIELDDLLRPSFTLITPHGDYQVKLPVMGEHMALNAAGAVAAAISAGVGVSDAVAGIQQAELSRWRMEVVRAPNGLLVINDAYNANPTSMRAALDSLARTKASDRVAVVGAMAELGAEGEAEHLAVANEAAELGIRLIAVDAPEYGEQAVHVNGRGEVRSVLGDMGEGIAVLVKGSRVAGLEAVAAELIEASS